MDITLNPTLSGWVCSYLDIVGIREEKALLKISLGERGAAKAELALILLLG